MTLKSPQGRRVAYAELQAVSNFSFLRGASHAEELVERAAALGLAAIGIADRNTLAGAVRAHVAAKAVAAKAVAAKAVAAKAVAAKASGLRLLTRLPQLGTRFG